MKFLKAATIVSQISLAFALLAPSFAKAEIQSCGLPDAYDSTDYDTVIGSSKAVKKDTKLTDIEGVQILVTARTQAKRNSDHTRINTTAEAIKYLKNNSESNDLYVQQEKANGKIYSVVLYWPGGNPVGLVFELNTSSVVGYIEDSTVYCK